MATTYTLKFVKFNILDAYDDGSNPIMNDVIRDVHFRIEAETDDPEPVTASSYGSVVLPLPTYGTFIARGSVTVSNVQTWFAALQNEQGDNLLQELKNGLDARINLKKNPTDHDDTPDNTFTDGVSV